MSSANNSKAAGQGLIITVLAEGGLGHYTTFQLTAFVIEAEVCATADTAQANFMTAADAQIMFGRNEPALHHYQRTQNELTALG